MLVAAARLTVFARAFARLVTSHNNIDGRPRLRLLARMMGEIVSLYALVHLATQTGGNQPAAINAAIFCGFILPTVLINGLTLERTCDYFGVRSGYIQFLSFGILGLLSLYVLMEVGLELLRVFSAHDPFKLAFKRSDCHDSVDKKSSTHDDDSNVVHEEEEYEEEDAE